MKQSIEARHWNVDKPMGGSITSTCSFFDMMALLLLGSRLRSVKLKTLFSQYSGAAKPCTLPIVPQVLESNKTVLCLYAYCIVLLFMTSVEIFYSKNDQLTVAANNILGRLKYKRFSQLVMIAAWPCYQMLSKIHPIQSKLISRQKEGVCEG